ncbi:MAG: hypothetical protein RLZZ41_418 [Actinomycetota bacterium]|jgi:hypothetical protein
MSPRNTPSALPEGEVVGQFKNYREAVKTVEQLVENGFPAPLISIIGSDLKTVETLKGKLGYGRVALSGAVTGSWVGLFFGLLFGATSTTEQVIITNLSSGIVIGAGVGMLLNVIRFSLAKNKRTFISAQAVVAKKYDVIVPTGQLTEAKKALKASPTEPKKSAAKKPASKG